MIVFPRRRCAGRRRGSSRTVRRPRCGRCGPGAWRCHRRFAAAVDDARAGEGFGVSSAAKAAAAVRSRTVVSRIGFFDYTRRQCVSCVVSSFRRRPCPPSSPPKPYNPTDDERRQIEDEDAGAWRDAAARSRATRSIADAAIYRKAADFILKQPGEFANPGYVKDTLAALDTGIASAKELAGGTASWTTRKGRVLRAYRSRIDGSIQPYGLIIPESYAGQPFRLDIWMHGTNRNLNEVAFIKGHEGAAPVRPTSSISRWTSTAAATWPIAGPARRTSSKRCARSRSGTRSTRNGSRCADSPWAGRARGTSACTIPTSGRCSRPAPASPRPRSTRRRRTCRRTRRRRCIITTRWITR